MVFELGNRCGHIPERPRFFAPPPSHANRPGILRQLIERLRDYYARPAETLPGLNACNQSDRQQRSERREACLALLGAILHYTDLVTLRVGVPRPGGGLAGLTMPYLAEISGLGERRAERAIHDLKAAGIITVHPRCERLEDLNYQGYAAIRTVTRHLFTVFGLGQWLEHERRKAKERRDKKLEKQRRKALANVRMATGAALGPERKPQAAPASADARTGEMKSVGQIAIENLKAMFKGGTGPPE